MRVYGELEHSGTPQMFDGDPHGSGRYRQGSGKNPNQHEATSSIRDTVKWMKSKGMSMDDIATGMGYKNQNELRKKMSLESEQEKTKRYSMIYTLLDEGKTPTEIAKILDTRESTIRGIRDKRDKVIADKTRRIADVIKEKISDGSYLEVGEGTENYFTDVPELKDILKVSGTRLDNALELLKEEGYAVESIKVSQATNPKQKTTVRLVAPPGTTKYDMQQNKDKIKTIVDYTVDGYSGETRLGIQFPKSLDSSRLQICYPDEGGGDKDGVIELRRGVEDISLGEKQYAQVRIAVDGTHYLKGMAIYADDLPDGVDVRFNTGKGRDKKVMGEILKPMKVDKTTGEIDKDNPFGAAIKVRNGEIIGQREYLDENGVKQLSLINKVNEEGDWDDWGRTLSSQFLSKQSMPMIERQLDITYKEKKAEFDDIMSLTLPEVKKQLLNEFADNCDSAAVDLKAAPFAGQSQKVILPNTKISEGQCYAPSYPNGTKLALIRYPHAGTFEIPTVTVNNNDVESKKIFGDIRDAIAITPLTARQLSGADFDGDSVTCIPLSDKVRVNTRPYFEDLKTFAGDFHDIYAAHENMVRVKDDPGFNKGIQMGKISNLITDMTLRGAPEQDILKAVKHSMVIIDAEKHNLDWRRSEVENDIPKLRKEWQGKASGGASTLISRSKGEKDVLERRFFVPERDIDPETGKKIFRETGNTYAKVLSVDEDGTKRYSEPIRRTEKSTKMYEALNEYGDARKISSGLPQEEAYAYHANRLYSLANEARKAYLSIKSSQKDPDAAERYSEEVRSLKSKLLESKKNQPKERYANIMTQATLMAKMAENPAITYKTKEGKEAIKKISSQALAAARTRYGARRRTIVISDKEWEAITNHAVGGSTLADIVRHADKDNLRALATPRESKFALPESKVSWLKSLKAMGYTTNQIAERTGISTSTISKYTA